jgi:hypothetical protein
VGLRVVVMDPVTEQVVVVEAQGQGRMVVVGLVVMLVGQGQQGAVRKVCQVKVKVRVVVGMVVSQEQGVVKGKVEQLGCLWRVEVMRVERWVREEKRCHWGWGWVVLREVRATAELMAVVQVRVMVVVCMGVEVMVMMVVYLEPAQVRVVLGR